MTMQPPKNGYKPGSGVAAVHEQYKAAGSQAAFDHGISLGLAASTLKSWCRGWDKFYGVDNSVTAAGTPAAVTEKPIKMHTKPLVTVSYCRPGRNRAYLIQQGPQASVIRFEHNGSEECLGNEWLGLPVERNDTQPVQRRLVEE